MKPHVTFGVAPFGIWRPNNPPGIVGMDAFDVLFADSKKWLNEGWLDYLGPQLFVKNINYKLFLIRFIARKIHNFCIYYLFLVEFYGFNEQEHVFFTISDIF